MRDCKYRFMSEYANEKKRRIKASIANFCDDEIIMQAADQAIGRIDGIITASRRGFFTIDEAMKDIASVDVTEIAINLRFPVQD